MFKPLKMEKTLTAVYCIMLIARVFYAYNYSHFKSVKINKRFRGRFRILVFKY